MSYDGGMLSSDRIKSLSTRKDVRTRAVTNFLNTLQGSTQDVALANLHRDARSYKWNAATVTSIRTGIVEFFQEEGAT